MSAMRKLENISCSTAIGRFPPIDDWSVCCHASLCGQAGNAAGSMSLACALPEWAGREPPLQLTTVVSSARHSQQIQGVVEQRMRTGMFGHDDERSAGGDQLRFMLGLLGARGDRYLCV